MKRAVSAIAVAALWAACMMTGEAQSASTFVDGATARLTGNFKWTCGPPILQTRHSKDEDWISIKDPSVVRYKDRWHLFCTVRGRKRTHAIVYLSFPEWNPAADAEFRLLQCHNGYFCAPQVFYFTPHQRWYLICQASDEKWSPKYQAAYSTTTDIADGSTSRRDNS